GREADRRRPAESVAGTSLRIRDAGRIRTRTAAHPLPPRDSPEDRRQPCLKYCTARSCFSAAARDLNVPRLLRLPVFGFFLREYNRYSPLLSFRIMGSAGMR